MKRWFKVDNVEWDDVVRVGLGQDGIPNPYGISAFLISVAELNVLADEAYSAVAAWRDRYKIPQWWEAL